MQQLQKMFMSWKWCIWTTALRMGHFKLLCTSKYKNSRNNLVQFLYIFYFKHAYTQVELYLDIEFQEIQVLCIQAVRKVDLATSWLLQPKAITVMRNEESTDNFPLR